MRVDELKNKILQLAIQGKLVPQDDNDIPASVLLEEIKKEKEKLIKEKKIKKEKPLPEITEEEKLFEIPKGWEWCRLPNVTLFQEGPGILAKDFRESGVPLIRLSGMQSDVVSLNGCNFLDEDMVDNKWSHFRLDIGDILVSSSASMGKVAKVDSNTEGAIPYTGLIRFKVFNGVMEKYFTYFMQSPDYMSQIEAQKSGTTIKHYGPTHLKNMIIPIPPLNEQQRIIDKIDELFAIIKEFAENKEAMLKNISDTRNKVLQLAIQGKLVEQNPEDTPASVLLEEIRKEKEQLIKEKKIKKEKPLPEIVEEEKLFKLPKGWEWVRVQDVLNVRRGASPRPISKFLTEDEGVNWIKIGDTNSNSKYIDSTKEKITVEGAKKSVYLEKGSLILSNSMSFGKPYILNINGCIHDGWLSLTTYRDLINKEFLRYVFLGSKNFFEKEAVGSGVRNLNIERVSKMPIALPSVAEQLRIVQKVDEIMAYLDELEKTIM